MQSLWNFIFPTADVLKFLSHFSDIQQDLLHQTVKYTAISCRSKQFLSENPTVLKKSATGQFVWLVLTYYRPNQDLPDNIILMWNKQTLQPKFSPDNCPGAWINVTKLTLHFTRNVQWSDDFRNLW